MAARRPMASSRGVTDADVAGAETVVDEVVGRNIVGF